MNSLLGRDGSCPRSPILKPAGCVELAGQGMLLPQKLYSQNGMVEKACLPGNAPAPEALFEKRQGGKSLLGGECSCPRSPILKGAGCEELAGQDRHLPRKLIFQTGRVRRASWPGDTPASEALFEKRQGGKSLLGGDGTCPGSSIHKTAGDHSSNEYNHATSIPPVEIIPAIC